MNCEAGEHGLDSRHGQYGHMCYGCDGDFPDPLDCDRCALAEAERDRDDLLAALKTVVAAFPDRFQRWEALIARIESET